MAKRIRIGDIAEVPTSKGLSYVQMTHKNKEWGSLIRILKGLFKTRPHEQDLAEIIRGETVFVTFLPLQAAVNRGIFEIIGNEEVPEHAKELPLFKDAGYVDREGRVHDWWLWDGERSWQIGKIPRRQWKLPTLAVINDTLLIERIEEGWTPEKDVR